MWGGVNATQCQTNAFLIALSQNRRRNFDIATLPVSLTDHRQAFFSDAITSGFSEDRKQRMLRVAQHLRQPLANRLRLVVQTAERGKRSVCHQHPTAGVGDGHRISRALDKVGEIAAGRLVGRRTRRTRCASAHQQQHCVARTKRRCRNIDGGSLCEIKRARRACHAGANLGRPATGAGCQ